MNLKIKFRESFRPFAPVVLRERVSDYFEMPPETDSPYMMLVAPVREDRRARVNGEQPQGLDRVKMVRSEIPAVTHVDYSARCKPWTPAATGASTSWSRPSSENRLSRHHQHQLQRARRTNRLRRSRRACFMATNMDALVVDRFVLLKSDQPASRSFDPDEYARAFQAD